MVLNFNDMVRRSDGTSQTLQEYTQKEEHDLTVLEGKVQALETTVGGSSSGLVKGVADLNTEVGSLDNRMTAAEEAISGLEPEGAMVNKYQGHKIWASSDYIDITVPSTKTDEMALLIAYRAADSGESTFISLKDTDNWTLNDDYGFGQGGNFVISKISSTTLRILPYYYDDTHDMNVAVWLLQ